MSHSTYPINELRVSYIEEQLLKKARIRTTTKLLEATKTLKGRQALAERTGISERRLLDLANYADLLQIKEVGMDSVLLMRAAFPRMTRRMLMGSNPGRLATRMREANAKNKVMDLLPRAQRVARWIQRAKELPVAIAY